MRARAALLSAGLLLSAPLPAVGEPEPEHLLAFFRESCLAEARPELRGTATWTWIEGLCEREARARADAFARLDRAGRLQELGRGCERWYAANGWRLPPALQEDAGARTRHVAAACAAEAEELLRTLER